jgi:hypothetical protein
MRRIDFPIRFSRIAASAKQLDSTLLAVAAGFIKGIFFQVSMALLLLEREGREAVWLRS